MAEDLGRTDDPGPPDHAPHDRRVPADRRIILLVVVLVAAVLVVDVVSGLIPGIDGALASLPIVVLVLVVGTVVVFARSIRR